MPAPHDIYSDQLRELQRGHPLYHPEPDLVDGAVEIGDVGFTMDGAFVRLFNAGRPSSDPTQRRGVPDGFEPLDLGEVKVFSAELEPGPLSSSTIVILDANLGATTG